MKSFVAPLVFALMFSCSAQAQQYVIELEGFVFDRTITEAERKLIEKRIEDVPTEDRSLLRNEETLAVLRQFARELSHFKTSSLAAMGQPVTHQADTEAMTLEASFSILERTDDSVKIDCQMASGYVNQQLTHSLYCRSPVQVGLGKREQIAGGGGQAGANRRDAVAIHQFWSLRVCEATAEDLKLRKVSDNFDEKLHKKLKTPTPPGGKVTLK